MINKIPDLKDQDRLGAIFAYVLLTLLGYLSLLVLPMLMGALVDYDGYTEEQIGYLAAFQSAGVFCACIFSAIYVAKFNRRYAISVALTAAILGNFLCLTTRKFELLSLFVFIQSAGGSAMYAIIIAIVAGTTKASRNYTYIFLFLGAGNAIMLLLFPYLAVQWGTQGLFLILGCLTLLGAPFVSQIPTYYQPDEQLDNPARNNDLSYSPSFSISTQLSRWTPWLGLAGVVGFYFMIGAYWAFTERIGISLEFSTEFISQFLASCTLFSIIGTACAYFLGDRFGPIRVLITGLATVSTVLLLFSLMTSPILYLIYTSIFFLMWNFIDILQVNILAILDHSGRYCAMTPAAQGLAMTIGPGVAGYLVGQGAGYSSIIFLGAGGVLFACFIYIYLFLVVTPHPAILDPESANG